MVGLNMGYLCYECDGTGKVHSHNPKCWVCRGMGQIDRCKAEQGYEEQIEETYVSIFQRLTPRELELKLLAKLREVVCG